MHLFGTVAFPLTLVLPMAVLAAGLFAGTGTLAAARHRP
jgi:hypothetical protein